MPLVTLQDIYLSYGQPPLIDHINLVIERGERVCLIGRNGAGKSTLLKILTGQITADDGVLKRASGVKIAQLEQSVPEDAQGSVFDVITQGLGAEGELAKRYHHLILELGTNPSDQTMRDLEECQSELDRVNGWDINQRVESIITKMDLDADVDISSLSGGYKRRVLLARALVCDPDLLLLDEPTNHLDIDAIQWVEQFLLKWEGSLLFISHDRRFMNNLATRFIEIDRGQLAEFNCNYATYLQRKEEILEVEDKQNALFDKRLSQEEVWIRQGIKARRTRNEGRVRALESMRREYADRRKRQGTARMDIQQAERSGKIVAEAQNISFAFAGDQQPVVRDFSTLIQRGDKVGFIGRNGVGKTTLIKLLLSELVPQQGSIKTGTNLNVAYFDQYRSALDEEKSVQDNVSGGRDMLEIGGKPKHVISYLQDFLFAPERCRQPVKALSGGERNRLLLAKLFTQPSNVLVLDEPTNDLDIDTLDLLEELLIDYKGTIILVSHDRAFLNNVVTSTLVFEGNGSINQYIGGYDDWLRQRKTEQPASSQQPAKAQTKASSASKKLSYKDQRELDNLPQEIENLETQIAELSEQISQPDFYRGDRNDIAETETRLSELQQQLSHCYDRWESLENL
ncbi:MAG: ATP-binding cassette domain-containing protein [Porticoccaceae bacterium]|jgi:ATP-binding cassette subfamily F protein uup|nr:ATP-binding cassette domain-containing protein [Porticoccaceae bacterium]MBT6320495.1 ATP-binding cassette domain-containing protein [Porticoccaceae bacterium]MBT7258670.1 ATP-binding cassette domain-containing protein [Porticoccaceae bacterium]MBT7903911.1 ATP-binding cassette domain-containing protein [Porticoccaceae bacterium]MDG1448239.1 ATP-binding cassette domain-containing protein [Porticoccaceae bacterium]